MHWHFAEFTKGGILKAGPSPYRTDKGESDCELFFQSAYVDRDNNRYGFVRELIPLQDEVNKRRSKALHLMSVNQLHYEDGAVGRHREGAQGDEPSGRDDQIRTRRACGEEGFRCQRAWNSLPRNFNCCRKQRAPSI